MLPGEIRQQREVRHRILIHRRDAHQAREMDAMILVGLRNKFIEIIRGNTRFLRFKTSVDLNHQFRMSALAPHFFGQSGHQLFAVDRLNDVKQGNGISRLVALQGSNQVQFNIGKVFLQVGPFLLSFLHAVFTKQPLPRHENRPDGIFALGFGDRNERNAAGWPMCGDAGPGNVVNDGLESLGDGVRHAARFMATLAGLGKDW